MTTIETTMQQAECRPTDRGSVTASALFGTGESDGQMSAQRRRGYRMMGMIWLIFLIYPVASLFRQHFSLLHRGLMLAGLAAFIALYLPLAIFRYAVPFSDTRLHWLGIAALFVLALVMSIAGGEPWLGLFIYCEATIGWLPPRIAVRFVVGTSAVVGILGLRFHDTPLTMSANVLQTALIGIIIISMFQLIRTNTALRAAQEELARLAVAEERLRFARDLHDLLGHSLSLITLKSELAGRLTAVSPQRAAAEIHDVEHVAREALREVRDAVAGYRQPTLAAELVGARTILEAAGITCEVADTARALPASTDAVLAWTVREGVTNVIRHSRARRCTIRVARDGDEAQVEVIDDGRGVGDGEANGRLPRVGGSGLPGLAERVAARGGRFEVGPLERGGFHLRVTLPISDIAVPAPAQDANDAAAGAMKGSAA
jgi:two-component system sensor histidine kinase DesK